MINLKIEEILKFTNGRLLEGKANEIINQISTDTRTINRGNLFIALKGNKFDGHDFIENAFKKGAKGIIVDNLKFNLGKYLCKEKTIILVKDSLSALQKIASGYRLKFDIPVIAITGSTGKTTTKEIVSHLLSKKFSILKTEENYNNEIGVPLTLLQLEKKHKISILEMAMRGMGEIRLLSEISKPDVGVITNIGVSHLERLKSKRNIAKAKSELIESLGRNGIAILNNDDRYVRNMQEVAKGKVIFYGIEKDTEVKASNIKNRNELGWEFDLEILGKKMFTCHLPLLGFYNIYNALAACSIIHSMGLDLSLIKNYLPLFKPVSGRLEVLRRKNVTIINDTYNSSPASCLLAMDCLNNLKGRKILVLGDMKELGDRSKVFHLKLGKIISNSKGDFLITVGEMGRFIAEGARNKMKNVFICRNNKEAISKISEILKPGDIILIKGSRAMRMEEIVKGI